MSSKLTEEQVYVIRTLPERDKYGNTLVECKCKFCGSFFTIRKSQVKTTKSCGCQKGHRSKNTYVIKGEVTEVFDVKGNKCLIDTEDLERVKQYYWYQDSRGYWLHHVSRNSSIYLHKFIMNVDSKDILVDHIFHNTCDNRKSKLRPCSGVENSRNKNLSKTNATGHVGVYKTNSNKFKSLIFVKGKEVRLGVFETFEEAVYAREEAEKQYYGDFRGGRYVN